MQRQITGQGLVALHKIIQSRFPCGVARGRIDKNKIEAIAAKPYMTLYGHTKYYTIYKKAACYLEGIVRMHPFPDGNKRTAILAASSFLRFNGHHLVIPLDTVKFLVCVAREEGRTEEEIDMLIDRIATWLEKRTATGAESLEEKIEQYISAPILELLKSEKDHVTRTLDDWLATDFHPEYRRNIDYIVQFLTRIQTDKELFDLIDTRHAGRLGL